MMSQQQNPPAVSRSLLQEADLKPFSIREYALACRERNMIESWPFPEKYLQMCLNRGIRDVLPPFALHQTNSSLKCCSTFILPQLQDAADNGSKGVHEEAAQQQVHIKNEIIRARIIKVTTNNHSSSSSHHALVSHPSSSILHVCRSTRNPTATLLAVKSDIKRRRIRPRRGNRCKKRSMVDILAVARHCTPEEIIRMNKFFYNTDHTTTLNNVEGCHQKIEPIFENVSKSKLNNNGDDNNDEEDYSCRKKSGIGRRREEDHQVANIGSLLVKFKQVNQWM